MAGSACSGWEFEQRAGGDVSEVRTRLWVEVGIVDRDGRMSWVRSPRLTLSGTGLRNRANQGTLTRVYSLVHDREGTGGRPEGWVRANAPPGATSATSATGVVRKRRRPERLRFGHNGARELEPCAHVMETRLRVGSRLAAPPVCATEECGLKLISLRGVPHSCGSLSGNGLVPVLAQGLASEL